MHDEMKNFTSNERNDLASLTFEYESLRIQRSVMWISDDRLEISDDEISRIKQRYGNVEITNEHADLDEISFVDGYSVSITCSSEGTAVSDCNINLFKQLDISCND